MIWLVLAAAGVLPADPQTDACFAKEVTQGGMDGCANEAFKRADAKLNVQWQKTAAAYKRLDTESKGLNGADAGFPYLLTAQRAWLQYRDATCHAIASGGGTIAPLNYSMCLVAMTQRRTQELDELAHNPNSGEPL